MKQVTAGLAVLLLSLFSISACIERDSTLGSALVPSDQDISINTTVFDLPVSLRISDSLQTVVSQSITVGSIRSNIFGLFRSEAAMTVTSSKDSVEWGKNATVRRVYISLARDTNIVIDKSQFHIPQNIYVHELTRQLDSSLTYNNSLNLSDYDSRIISRGDILYNGGEIFTVDLDHSFGEKFLKLPTSVRDSAQLLMKEIPGLYMTCDEPEKSLEGGRLNVFNLSSSSLIINYTYEDEDGNTRSSSAVFDLGKYFTLNVSSSSAGHLVTDNPADAIYMEGLCGIKPHISAKKLYETVKTWADASGIALENLIIAKAALEFPFEYNGDKEQFYTWSGNMYPCTRATSSAGKKTYAPIEQISETSYESGTLDRSLLQYKSNISVYLQELLRSDPSDIDEDDDLWMMPTVSYTDNHSNTYYYPDYFYYKQNVLNGTGAERHPVLKLTYTVLK